jgi:hypothetical protein
MLSNYEGKNHLVLQHSPLMAAKAAGLNVTWTPGHSLNLGLNDRSHIKDAVAAAKAADIAVVMVGLCADNCDKEGGGNGRGIEDEVRKRHFLRHLYIKCIILPRQARDKHRESTQKRDVFLQGFDRGRIALPGAQEQLLEAVVAAQPKTVMVMITGGAISISWCVVR